MSVVSLASSQVVEQPGFNSREPASFFPGSAAPLPFRRRWSRRVALDVIAIVDMLCVIAGGLVPALLFPARKGFAIDWVMVLQSSIVAGILAGLCLKAWGCYECQRFSRVNGQPLILLATVSIVIGAVMGLTMSNAVASGNLLGWQLAWAGSSFVLLYANRFIAQRFLQRLVAAGRFDQRVAVFGAGGIARRVHDHLSKQPEGVYFAGVYDDRIGEDRINPEGLCVAGRLVDLVEAARAGELDQIIVALPQTADRRISDIAKKLEQLPVSIHIVTHISSDFVDLEAAHRVSSLGPVGLIDVKKKPLADWGPLVKRLEDYILGTALLLMTAPLFPLIALAIRLDSRGPVLFAQRRRGRNQHIINVYKFRTMSVMEDGADVRQVAKGDPRITRVGRILRSTSLDELPQLINVLKGEMSLVGPRPHALVHDEHYGEMLETYANRHQVKPGITGLAQVRGYRGETSSADKMRSRVESDIAYIQNWSLGLDLKILVQTFWAVATRRNAH